MHQPLLRMTLQLRISEGGCPSLQFLGRPLSRLRKDPELWRYAGHQLNAGHAAASSCVPSQCILPVSLMLLLLIEPMQVLSLG